MKDINFSKPTGMNSLGQQFSLVVFLATLLAGLAVAYTTMLLQEMSILNQQRLEVERSTLRYAAYLDNELQQKEQKAIAANQVVSRMLAQQPLDAEPVLQAQPDGSIRSQDSYSAAFIAAERYHSGNAALFPLTEQIWQQLSPLMLQDFFNFYFISSQQFIRIAPSDWALEVPANHDFNKDVFYSIGTPEQNPGRSPRWTPVYYDNIWQKWVTSLIVPVYVNEQFLGVLGADFELSEMLAKVHAIEQWSQHSRAFMFDQQGNVATGYYSANDRQLAMNTPFMGQQLANDSLQQFATQVASAPGRIHQTATNVPEHLVHAAPVTRLGWFVAVYADKSDVLSSVDGMRSKLMMVFIVVALIAALSLHAFTYQFILKRLNRLSDAIHRVYRGDLSKTTLDSKSDEIGILNQAFERMADEITDLVSGLNARIEEKEHAERAARKLSKAVSFSSSGIILTDQKLKIEYINPFLSEMMGCRAEILNKQPLTVLFADEMHHLSSEIIQILAERQHWRGDMLLQYSDRQLWVSLAIAPIRDEKGELSNYVCAMQDISFIKQSQKKMEQLAYYDVLTGLANRSYFRDQLRKAIAMAHRGYYSFALLYFDLDEFKRINDTLGHDAGDELLKEVAKRLIGRLREEDTIARLGGDEFAVILSGITDRQQASVIANNLQQAFTAPVMLGSYEVSVSASIGITVAPEDAAEEELLLKHADLAMYEAKARGKNTYHFFSQDLNDAANERLLIESQLREAIREHQFMLHYQPKIDIRDNTIIGYETLLRWLRPDNTLVPPLRFIGVAENTGLIVQIGEWIIWEACRFLSRQHSRGHNISLSINLSARQFSDENLPEIVERILKRTGASPEYLIFEITESMLMGDTDAAVNQLNQLKRLGVTLSIDDFGTGYSSLSYLKRFPVDELKIDRSFVKDIPEDRNDMDIVAAIIAMAQKMNLQVVAEGVETAEQVDFLRNNACYQVQGYYFSKPLAEHELSQLNYAITQ